MKHFLLLCFLVVQMLASDSIPTWQIIYSRIYHQQFVTENTEYDLSLLREQNKQFHSLVSQYFNTALNLIPVFSGVDWKKNYHINIYPNRSKQSFSHPLTISYNKNQYFMFYTLIHEAVHHNLTTEFPTRVMDEALCDKVAIKVAKYIDDVIYDQRKYSVYFGLQKFYTWDLDSLSIAEWWTENETRVSEGSKHLAAFESELFHTNEAKQSDLFEKIQNTRIQEYQEEAFKKWIDYFEKRRQWQRAIQTSNRYLKDFPRGAYANLVRFKLANFHLSEGNKDAANTVLAELRSKTAGINNYLDDLYVLLGRLNSSDADFVQSFSQFLYVIETLPNGYAKAEAYKNLGRIYMRLENLAYAGKFYTRAFEYTKRNDKRGQLLVEMRTVNGALDTASYKKNIIDVLRLPLKKNLYEELEDIYKSLLD